MDSIATSPFAALTIIVAPPTFLCQNRGITIFSPPFSAD
jgi:hypothetical protein